MGCINSSSNNTSKSLQPWEEPNTTVDLEQLNRDLLQRKLEQEEFEKQLYDDKEQLSQYALQLIQRSVSCESLMDALEKDELFDISTDEAAFRAQKRYRRKLMKRKLSLAHGKWMLYNNLDGITEINMVHLAMFMQKVLHVLPMLFNHQHHQSETLSTIEEGCDELDSLSSTSIHSNRVFSRHPSGVSELLSMRSNNLSSSFYFPSNSCQLGSPATQRDNIQLGEWRSTQKSRLNKAAARDESLLLKIVTDPTIDVTDKDINLDIPLLADEFSSSSKKHMKLSGDISRYRKELLALEVSIIAPQSLYEITRDNIYDYDLPPGLVTLRVAKTIIDLYRRGGRLTPKSVKKLLRLAYKTLSRKSNIIYTHIEKPNQQLIVVGDIHGQLPDLLHILDNAGLPNKNRKYIFNGDFVDRGSYGVEVMCILLALHIALPDHVLLNRGNHEDFAICTAYGFQIECYEKYDELIFGMFVEVFQQLPLFTIVNDAIFILHGGLFHSNEVSLEDLQQINRSAFTLQDIPDGGEGINPVPKCERTEYLKQLIRDALWSDPNSKLGVFPSVRGAGVCFGPDITRSFLKNNNLKFVVRSHECVCSGYEEPYFGKDAELLCTIFSASDYGGGSNTAAYLVFQLQDNNNYNNYNNSTGNNNTSNNALVSSNLGEINKPYDKLIRYVRETNIYYKIHHFNADPAFLRLFEDEIDISSTQKNLNDNSSSSSSSSSSAGKQAVHSNSNCDLMSLQIEKERELINHGNNNKQDIGVDDNIDEEEEEDRSDTMSISLEGDATNNNHIVVAGLSRGSLEETHKRNETIQYTTAQKKVNYSTSSIASYTSIASILEANASVVLTDKDCVLIGSRVSLRDFLCSRRQELQDAFNEHDKLNVGVVAKYIWLKVMREVMNIHIRWISVMQLLVLEEHFRVYKGKKMVDYVLFLNSIEKTEDLYFNTTSDKEEDDVSLNNNKEAFNKSFLIANPPIDNSDKNKGSLKRVSFQLPTDDGDVIQQAGKTFSTNPESSITTDNSSTSSAVATTSNGPHVQNESYQNHMISEELMGVLYSNYKQIQLAFEYFDQNDDGFITKDEFRLACKEVNQYLSSEAKIKDIEEILMLMDLEENGEIPFNIFFEIYRLSEIKLYVGIDEEDSATMSSLHHSESKDNIKLRSTSMRLSGSNNKAGLFQEHLAIHGVEINIDTVHGEISDIHTNNSLRHSIKKHEISDIAYYYNQGNVNSSKDNNSNTTITNNNSISSYPSDSILNINNNTSDSTSNNSFYTSNINDSSTELNIINNNTTNPDRHNNNNNNNNNNNQTLVIEDIGPIEF